MINGSYVGALLFSNLHSEHRPFLKQIRIQLLRVTHLSFVPERDWPHDYNKVLECLMHIYSNIL